MSTRNLSSIGEEMAAGAAVEIEVAGGRRARTFVDVNAGVGGRVG